MPRQRTRMIRNDATKELEKTGYVEKYKIDGVEKEGERTWYKHNCSRCKAIWYSKLEKPVTCVNRKCPLPTYWNKS